MNLDKIIEEKWTGISRKGYVNIRGFMVPDAYQEKKNEYDNLEVKNSDIWVCTFPKCCTTWTQELVWLIVNNVDFEGAKRDLDERFVYLELSSISNFDDIKKDSPNFESSISNFDDIKKDSSPNVELSPVLQDSLSLVKLLKEPRCIKTHFPFQLLPKQIQDGSKKPKIIYVARNPKDVCVSYYHHNRIFDHFSMNFEEFCELFLAGKITYGPFWDHILPFWKMRDSPNILFLHFEDMKKDLRKSIIQVSEFLGRPLKDDDIEKLHDHLSFEKLSKNPAVNKQHIVEVVKSRNNLKDAKFMRKGVVGDYKASMTPEMIKRFDEWINKSTEGTGYVNV